MEMHCVAIIIHSNLPNLSINCSMASVPPICQAFLELRAVDWQFNTTWLEYTVLYYWLQSQKAVTARLKNEQSLPFGFARRTNTLHTFVLNMTGGGPRVVVSTAAFHARVRGSVPGLGGLKVTKNVSSPSTCESQYCGEPPWPRGSVLGLRPPGLEFRILCLEDSVISIISPSSGGSPGPV